MRDRGETVLKCFYTGLSGPDLCQVGPVCANSVRANLRRQHALLLNQCMTKGQKDGWMGGDQHWVRHSEDREKPSLLR